jgi:hypothetical protein
VRIIVLIPRGSVDYQLPYCCWTYVGGLRVNTWSSKWCGLLASSARPDTVTAGYWQRSDTVFPPGKLYLWTNHLSECCGSLQPMSKWSCLSYSWKLLCHLIRCNKPERPLLCSQTGYLSITGIWMKNWSSCVYLLGWYLMMSLLIVYI